jgi:hypothetical protein
MPDLPRKKVGIVSCSGEEQLRPADTVTICLPLFLAGGEGDRAFARFYPTIAIDGCDKRCAARGTEMYSGKPAASIVVTELVAERGLGKPEGKRHLNEAGQQAVEATAGRISELVFLWFRDTLAGSRHQRADGHPGRPAAHLPAVPRLRQTRLAGHAPGVVGDREGL